RTAPHELEAYAIEEEVERRLRGGDEQKVIIDKTDVSSSAGPGRLPARDISQPDPIRSMDEQLDRRKAGGQGSEAPTDLTVAEHECLGVTADTSRERPALEPAFGNREVSLDPGQKVILGSREIPGDKSSDGLSAKTSAADGHIDAENKAGDVKKSKIEEPSEQKAGQVSESGEAGPLRVENASSGPSAGSPAENPLAKEAVYKGLKWDVVGFDERSGDVVLRGDPEHRGYYRGGSPRLLYADAIREGRVKELHVDGKLYYRD